MPKAKIDSFVIIAVFVIVLVGIGEVGAYYSYTNNYGSSVQWTSSGLEYSVNSNGSDGYKVVAMNHSEPLSELCFYLDSEFDSNLSKAREVDTVLGYNQNHAVNQMMRHTQFRGLENTRALDESGLFDYLSSTLSDPKGKGVMVIGYELPSAVYSGHSTDLLFEWIDNGGTLYWAGSEIGKFYSEAGVLHSVSNNQELFFGVSECVYKGTQKATETDGVFCRALSLQNSRMNNALSAAIPNSLAIGYFCEGYASVSLVAHGLGTVCVFSGDLSLTQYDDMAQVISAGITPHTTLADCQAGDVRGTVNGHVSAPSDSAYIYIGGVNTVYGRAYHV